MSGRPNTDVHEFALNNSSGDFCTALLASRRTAAAKRGPKVARR
jgi:hypothetical protein